MSEQPLSLFWIQFWQISLLIPVTILIVRYVLGRAPHLAYGLLLLVLVKTIFPPLWDSPTGHLWDFLPGLTAAQSLEPSDQPVRTDQIVPTETPMLSAPQTMGSEAFVSTPPPHAEQSSATMTHTSQLKWSWEHLLAAVWGAGVLCLLGYILGKRAQLLRFHHDTQVPVSDRLLELVETVSANLGLICTPQVLVTLHPTVPFASGLWTQIVVLPAHVVEQTEPEELKLILAHEMTHLRRGDTLVGLLQLVVQVLWWFHPLVYWLNREVRRIREECCDADVVFRLNCQPVNYARCLLNMLELHCKLRPATELIGLSPLEVTAKRMQNIMRTPQQPVHPLRNYASSLLLILFALAILPATARSYSTPKVIVGAIAPDAADQVPHSESSSRPQRPELNKSQKNPSKPKVATSPSPPKPEESQLPILNSPLKYSWKVGEQFRYQVTLEAQYPTQIRTHSGTATFKINSLKGDLPNVQLLSPRFKQTVEDREGIELPSLPHFDVSEDFLSPLPFAIGPPSRRTFPGESSSAILKGSNGHLDPGQGELPYFLGQLQDWVFPQLPQTDDGRLQIELKSEMNLLSEPAPSLNPFATPHREPLQAQIKIETQVGEVTEHSVTLVRDWQMLTSELVHGDPRREVSLVGRIQLARDDSFPIHVRYEGRLVEREPNREYRVPLTLEFRRVE